MIPRDTSAGQLSTPAPTRGVPPLAWLAATIAGLVLVAGSVAWLHYGTTVFFEMIASGIAACF